MNIATLKYFTGLLLLVLLATSCRKVIDLKLGNHTGELVIEGNFTNDPGPQYVKISRNVPFTNTNTYPAVTGATVTIFDNTNGHYFNMTEGPAGTYSVKKGVGIAGHSYTMGVTINGQTYTANSTMPGIVTLDSITSARNFLNKNDSQRMISVYFKDPVLDTNQYRFVMKVNHVQVKSIFAFDDEFINGKYVNLDLQENDINIFPNDTVTVEMQCIDRPVYNYWHTLMQQQGDNPGGAVAPANPPTNITPATLGYFSAHTTQTITLVVK